MRILHYTLGFPPNRSGGLVKYSIDLMEEQLKHQNNVFCLYPGKKKIVSNEVSIIKQDKKNINVYQIVNSLPLALFGGIREPGKFMKACDNAVYNKFLQMVEPDVIHIHTLMGLHQEFLEEARNLNIPIVFTTHDYFGLSPEPNFYTNGISYDNDNSVTNWMLASEKSMSIAKLRLFQWQYYHKLRSVFKFSNKVYRINKKNEVIKKEEIELMHDEKKYEEFSALKKYYENMFKNITKFHFNSHTSKEIYLRNLTDIKDYKVISITTSSINKKNSVSNNTKNLSNKKIRLGYIGPDKDYKGFRVFQQLASILDKNIFEFHTYGYERKRIDENINEHGKYRQEELSKVYESFDILIVPSQWKETFGLIVLESLSQNTIVFVSENVGAKDLINQKYIFRNLSELLYKVNNYRLFPEKYCLEDIVIKNMSEHYKEIKQFYNSKN